MVEISLPPNETSMMSQAVNEPAEAAGGPNEQPMTADNRTQLYNMIMQLANSRQIEPGLQAVLGDTLRAARSMAQAEALHNLVQSLARQFETAEQETLRREAAAVARATNNLQVPNPASMGRPTPTNSPTPDSHDRPIPQGQYVPTVRATSEIGEIPEYKGERKDDAAAHWLWKCERIFADRVSVNNWYTPDDVKVALARVKLKGNAEKMWLARDREVEANRAATIVTWDEFRKWILHHFGEIDADRRRLDKWNAIVQGKDSVQTYAMKLYQATLLLNPPMPPEYVVYKLVAGLKTELRARWEGGEKRPPDFDGAVDTLVRYERAVLAEKGALRGMTSTADPTDDPGDPMDLSVLNSPNPPARDSPHWTAWCRANDACFTCGKKDHRRQQCPKKKNNKGKKNSSAKKGSSNAKDSADKKDSSEKENGH